MKTISISDIQFNALVITQSKEGVVRARLDYELLTDTGGSYKNASKEILLTDTDIATIAALVGGKVDDVKLTEEIIAEAPSKPTVMEFIKATPSMGRPI
jgi:hypothetical protein